MTTILTPNLRLRIDSKLTSNAKYNLQRIDLLGATFLVDSTNTLKIRSQSDILIDPNSPDIGGTGRGSVTIGDPDRKATSLTVHADELLLDGAFNLLDQAVASTGKLGLVYKSDINGSLDNTARVLNIDVDGADRNLVLGGNLSLIGNDLILNATGPTDITLPETGTLSTLAGEETFTNKTIDADQNTLSNISNDEIKAGAGIEYSKLDLADQIVDTDIAAAAAISGTKIVPDFGAQDIRTEGVLELNNGTNVTAIAPAESGQTEDLTFKLPSDYGVNNAILSTDGAGNLIWSSAGSGSVTSVDLEAPAEFIVSGNPVTTTGTLTLTKANQTANQVYAGPETGADAEPTFRPLVLADLPPLTSADVGLGDVDNTSDLDKPISTATQLALDNKQDTLGFTPEDSANRGQPNGYAPLNALGKLDGIYLDSPVSSVNGETGDVTVNAISELTGDVTAGPASGSASAVATIAAGAITDSKVSASADIAVSKLATGTEGQVLQVVAGVPTWGAAPVSVESFKADWITADGTTKAITHSLGTSDVLIQIFDKSNGQSVEVDSIIRSSINAVSLTASQAPGASGWRVLILAI